MNKHFNFNKSEFTLELKKKSDKMKDYRHILFMKYKYLKVIVDIFQISIIIVSTIITFFESIKNHILVNEKKAQIISICLSTYIGVFTAIFRFLKIDDRKEEIYKILQIITDNENIINNKIKNIKLLQNSFDDDIHFLNKKNIICCKSDISNINIMIEDISYNVCVEEKEKTEKYYNDYYKIVENYKNEDIDQKILNAKKEFDSIFSYNEIIYYKGKIIESMLLDQVHETNRIILEAPIDNIKQHIIKNNKKSKSEKDEEKCDIENSIYNEDDNLYNNTFCNNICLYFSNICKFCLIMNLYLNLSIKRAKIRSLKKRLENDNLAKFHFSCCRIKCFNYLTKKLGCNNDSCCVKDNSDNTIYYCCDC